MVTLLYVFIWWDLVPTSSWGKLHLVPRAVVIVTMISIRTHSVLNTQFLQVTDFHGFILFSVSLIPVYHRRIRYFPVMGVVKSGLVGVHFFKERGRGDEKRKGADTPFCTMSRHEFDKNLVQLLLNVSNFSFDIPQLQFQI